MTARHFATPAEFRAWLEDHHVGETELLVGFFKTGTGRPTITWPEAVDEALCFGWIDGMRKRVDDQRYTIRFTPRRSRSIWSTVNIQRIEELQRLGLMRPAGLEAFARRAEERSNVYAYEHQERATLDESDERQFRANDAAWTFFQAQPNWYRKAAVWWVVSAKKDDTRRKRLTTLIEDSAGGRTVRPLTRPGRHESEAGAGL